MRAPLRGLPVGLIAAAAAFLISAPAQAATLVASDTNCSTSSLSQPFLPWADVAEYELAPGGNFEAGAPAWTLSGGARVVSGNESFYVDSASDSQSLSLPAGSSATSPTTCVGIENPDLRLFAVNSGDPSSTLAVSVNYETLLGPASTQIGTVTSTGTWEPSAQMPLLVNLLPLLPNNETPVSFTVTPQGAGNWQIDDVYIDPWGQR
jgi:hypothetical protein